MRYTKQPLLNWQPQLRSPTACPCCHARQPLALQTGREASAIPLHPQLNALFRCNLPRCAAGARAADSRGHSCAARPPALAATPCSRWPCRRAVQQVHHRFIRNLTLCFAATCRAAPQVPGLRTMSGGRALLPVPARAPAERHLHCHRTSCGAAPATLRTSCPRRGAAPPRRRRRRGAVDPTPRDFNPHLTLI